MGTWQACRDCTDRAREDKISKEVMFRSGRAWPQCFMCWLDRHPTPVRMFRSRPAHMAR